MNDLKLNQLVFGVYSGECDFLIGRVVRINNQTKTVDVDALIGTSGIDNISELDPGDYRVIDSITLPIHRIATSMNSLIRIFENYGDEFDEEPRGNVTDWLKEEMMLFTDSGVSSYETFKNQPDIPVDILFDSEYYTDLFPKI